MTIGIRIWNTRFMLQFPLDSTGRMRSCHPSSSSCPTIFIFWSLLCNSWPSWRKKFVPSISMPLWARIHPGFIITPKTPVKCLETDVSLHGLRTTRQKIAFTARLKIHSHSQILRYGGSIFCLPHRPIFSDILDLCLHWVSVVRG